MKRFTTLCLFFAAFALFVGCSEDEEDFTGTINGIVTDADSGEPMNAVNISLNPGGKSAVTGTDGRYEFLDLEPGQYTVQAAKNDYQTNTKHVTIVAGGTVKSDIVLQKATSKLKLTNNSLNFGKNWSALSFGVGNAGITGKIDWRISSDIDWITVSPLSGTTETGKNTEVIVTVLRDKVSGPANGIITISDDGGSLPVYVTVNQDVQAADGENRITVEPENVELSSAYRKDITICSYNSSANYELFVKEEDVSWLTFTKTMGILPVYNAEKPNTAVTVGFIADRSGLPAGEYKCTAVLRTGMGDLEIPVSMKVNADGSVDKTFEDFILENYDTDKDGVVSDEEAAGVTSIDCSNQGLVSLSGIERFTNLIDLNCSYNRLTELSLKNNVKLQYLKCDENYEMTSLDVSSNTALQSLTCGNNPLGTLDVSKNTELTHLACWNNSLTALDVSNNTKLEVLHCFINQLADLDISKNLALTNLSFGDNQISSIDISKNTELTELYCTSTKMQILDISANKKLQSVNCTDNESLTTIYAFSNYAATCTIEKPDATQIIVAGSGDSGNAGDMETVFPDANFRAYVLENFDTDNDDVISDEEAAGVTEIDVRYGYGDIASLQGIDKFVNLTSLNCYGQKITTLDVSGCPALTFLNCGGNQLTTLDISGCPALTNLSCGGNQLTTLNVSGCPSLTSLSCEDNQLTSVDLSENLNLEVLNLNSNPLQATILDLSKHTKLRDLHCENYSLTTVYLRSVALNYVWKPDKCTLIVPNSIIPDPYFYAYCINNFDFNGDGILSEQEAQEVTAIGYRGDAYSLQGIEYFTNLKSLSGQANITTLDLSKNKNLESLGFGGNYLTSLDVSNCTKLGSIEHFYYNGDGKLVTLNASGCTSLTKIDCGGNNKMQSINVDDCINLEYLRLGWGEITSLDVSSCVALTTLYCSRNQLSSLDLTLCPLLQYLDCSENQLTVLDVSKCTALENLTCGKNQIKSLSVKGFEKLKILDCYDNQIAELDVEGCTALSEIYCYQNLLEALNINSCKNLRRLSCLDNRLTTLDIKTCSDLSVLYCGTNLLTTLDISANKGLSEVNCDDNTLLETIYAFPDYSSTCTIYRRNTNAQIVIKE